MSKNGLSSDQILPKNGPSSDQILPKIVLRSGSNIYKETASDSGLTITGVNYEIHIS